MAITAALVKELRDRTSAGMMDCKKALEACDADMEKAVLWLREKGIAKAQNKAGRTAAEGLTKVLTEGNRAVLIEVNSETDFVAKNDQFTTLLDQIASIILASDVKSGDDVNDLKIGNDTLGGLIINATATIGENIQFRRFEVIKKTSEQVFGTYMHMGGKISAITVLDHANEELAKDIAMQVASMTPQFVSRDEMDDAFIKGERSIQKEIAMNDESLKGKPEKVLEGIVEGRLSKMLKDISLVDQDYFKDSDMTVGKYLQQSGATVVGFKRYAVGEGIDKESDECSM